MAVSDVKQRRAVEVLPAPPPVPGLPPGWSAGLQYSSPLLTWLWLLFSWLPAETLLFSVSLFRGPQTVSGSPDLLSHPHTFFIVFILGMMYLGL